MSLSRKFLIMAAATVIMAGTSLDAGARPGKGSSSGSRGANTFNAPPATNTAPRPAAPIERSATPQQAPSASALSRPGAPAAKPGFFSGAMGKGLLGGLIGAGLIGMLMGNGLSGGLGGIMSFLGLLLQIGLVFLIVKFAIGFFRNRNKPALSAAGPQGNAYQPQPQPMPDNANAQSGLFGGLFGGGNKEPEQPQVPTKPLTVAPTDFEAFERNLQDIQSAFTNGDVNRLKMIASEEMCGYFQEDLQENERNGVVNKIVDTKLVKGDLSEAWSEPDAEYATVAMRFSLIDTMVEKASGRVVSGNPNQAEEVTEIWTFVRRPGGTSADWKLSAIQQA